MDEESNVEKKDSVFNKIEILFSLCRQIESKLFETKEVEGKTEAPHPRPTNNLRVLMEIIDGSISILRKVSEGLNELK